MAMSRKRAEVIVSAILGNLYDHSVIGDALKALDDDVWEDMAESLVDDVQRAVSHKWQGAEKS
jgi:uncharacterized protein with ATP-grasp and redox domains